MRYSTQIKPISCLKANATEVLSKISECREPLIITQNGMAKAVLQDVNTQEETQAALSLLKILALGNAQVAQGKTRPLEDVIKSLRAGTAERTLQRSGDRRPGPATPPQHRLARRMSYHVLLAEDAEVDLRGLYAYSAHADSVQNADRVLARLPDIAESLVASPERGSIPQELRQLGLNGYRRIFFKPYRLVYRMHGHDIVIYLITGGRRDMETLLFRRLLRN